MRERDFEIASASRIGLAERSPFERPAGAPWCCVVTELLSGLSGPG
jgi:hypothetical protein